VTAEALLFTAAVSIFMLLRAASGEIWPPAGKPWFSLGITAINSAALLVSGALVLRVDRLWREPGRRAGPVLLGAIGFAAGEAGRWTWEGNALFALLYLVVFGSCIAYAAYLWLLHEVSPAALATYAYINPAVAVMLGWWLLGESLNGAQMAGMLVILLGVLLVSLPDKSGGHRA